MNAINFEARDIREDVRQEVSERARLEAAREAFSRRGNQLIRMARQCNEAANECFDNAYLIEKQLEVVP